ncbi:MAG: choice-of-anchor L domain-containing protein, partial [Chitinophagales bacterium]
MKKLLTLTALLTCFTVGFLQAQLQVTANNNASQLAQVLAGAGVTVSNFTINCPSTACGTFSNGGSTNLGITSGVALTTGTIGAVPNTGATFASTDNANGGDADLNNIAPASTQDVCVLQFNIVPQGNTLNFRYVFGSEEYPEYVCSQFNDVFGFFITGPNPGGGNYNKSNIALIPNTSLSVSINAVNPGSPGAGYAASGCQSLAYSQYYTDNQNGATIVYDGFTTVLNANIAVVPCQTYTLKLAIGDAGDGVYDSGVFLEASSFVSGTTTVTATVDPGFTSTFEGCVGGYFTINVPNLASSSTPVQYTVSGTATNGVDYPTLSGTAYVNPGTSTALVYVDPLTDNLPEGTETVTISVLDPCTGQPVSSATLNIQDKPVDTAYASSYLVCSGDQVQLTATGGGTYSWTPTTGLSNPNIANPVATIDSTTTYTVTINFGSCTDTKSVTINSNKLTISAETFPNTPVCPGDSVVVGASLGGGTGTVTYQWAPPSAVNDPSAQITYSHPLVTTTYSVTATDQTGCTATGSATAQVFVLPNVTLGPDQFVCVQDTPITLTPSGGPYNSYNWSTGETSSSINVSGNGTYSVTVVDASSGCSVTSSSVNITIYPQSYSTLSDTGACPGATVILSIDPGFHNATWSTGANTNTIPVNTAGTYWFTALDANNCPVASDTIDFSLAPAPIVNATASPDTICFGATSTLDANATGGVTYSWTPTGDTTSTITTGDPGIYIVEVSNLFCSTFDTIELFQYPYVLPVLTADQTVCPGASVTVGTTATYVSYTWNTGETTPTITVTTPGDYWVTVNDGNCTFVSDTFTLSNFVVTNPTLPDTGACADSDITLAAGPGLTNISWSTGATTSTITVGSDGDYWYTATDANGCAVASDTSTVTFALPPSLSPTASPDTICFGSPSVLAANANGANLTYVWNTGDTSATITVTTAGVYSVTVSDGFCPNDDTVAVYEFPHEPLNIIGNPVICSTDSSQIAVAGGFATYVWNTGDTTQAIWINVAGSYWATVTDANCTYVSDTFTLTNFVAAHPALPDTGACTGNSITLTTAPGIFPVLWSTGELTTSITVTTAGDYFYGGIDANGCIVLSDTATITFTPAPTVNPTASPDTICAGGSSVLSANATGTALTYVWSTGDTTASITVSSAGTYDLTVSNGFCPVTSSVTVYQYNPITVSLGNDQQVCPGATVVLTPSGGPYVTYNWSNGTSGSTLSTSTPGDYWVTVNDGHCDYVSDTFTLSNFTVVNPTLPDTGACQGTNVTLNAGTGYTNIGWSTGASTASITVTTSGDYWYTATDANGCTVHSDTSTVNILAQPTVNPIANPDTICLGGSTTISANATGTNLSYSWSTTATTSSITVSATGTYTVTVSNGFCSNTGSITISQYGHPPVTLPQDQTVCPGSSVNLSPSGSPYVSYAWSNGQSTPTVSVSAPGNYWVTVNDGHCSYVSDTFTLSNYTLIQPVAHSDTTVCDGQSAVLTADADYNSYQWSNGQSGISITVSTAGSYTYTATDANGCTVASTTAVVTTSSTPSPVITATPPVICLGQNTSTLDAGSQAGVTYTWSPTGGVGNTITVS